MPVTLANSRITIEWQSGDPTWFDMQDVIDASVAGGWNPPVTQVENTYHIPYSLYIQGVGTVFNPRSSWAPGTILLFTSPSPEGVYQFVGQDGAELLIGGTDNSPVYNEYPVIFQMDDILPTINRRILINCKATFKNVVFLFIYYTYLNGVDDDNRCTLENVFGINLQFGFYFGEFTYAKNVQSIGGYYGLQCTGVGSASDVLIKNHNVGLLVSGQIITMRNILIEESILWDTYQRCGNTDSKILTFIDCRIDKAKMSWYISGSWAFENKNIQYLQSTFSMYISDELGVALDAANIKLYGSEGTLLLDTDTIDGEALDNIVTYFETWRTLDGTQQIIDEDSIDYEPMRMVVHKSGYQDTIINGIYVNPGSPTIINISMAQPIYAELPEVTEVDEEPTTIAIIEIETQ